MTVILFYLPNADAFSQLGFFDSYWEPKSIDQTEYTEQILSPRLPQMIVSLDMSDTIRKISPYIGGYNLNTYYGGRMYDKPELLNLIRNLDLPFTRFPGGSGSNWYFWDRSKPNLPEDVDYMIIKGETVHISDQIKWGDIPGRDYLSLDNSYILRDSCNNEAIHVVNYSYARYGRSEDPVTQAAHYAADWVRYDNGRTRFWEIGNEIYGAWEPGYIIDTSRNKDGQPLQITGELYARHCLVFLDSMRAAASEIGAEIKIGATLGFQESRSEWDDPVIRILKDQVDFYIVHKYFGNGEDATPAQVFQGIEEFYQHKAYTDGLINRYCDTYVPLVITEWNTRYEGSYQNVSCANGMHTMLGLKAIINEGLGLSCKWNLIWGYQDGNTHGLISGEKDDPSIEGIPKYYPRAPFFYQYYFKKFLGDVSIRPFASATEGIDVFGSSFESGQAGAVLVNTTNTVKHIAVNLENYLYGERYYWFLLTPDNGQAFSRKVTVNGQTNATYAAGGPADHDEIQPWSAELREGLRIELPPYGSAFVLAEGNTLWETKNYQLSFTVYGKKEEIVTPLENAVVRIDGRLYLTDDSGGVSINVGGGNISYEILANGHEMEQGYITVNGTSSVTDTLQYKKYKIQLELTDSGTLQPIRECTVDMGGLTGVTDENGRISFSGIDYGEYMIRVRNKVYKEDISASIYSDTTIALKLDSTLYEVGFRVIDMINDDPVNVAIIDWNGEVIYTDINGTAVISGYYGNYNYSVSKSDFGISSASIELVSDTIIEVSLSPEIADIKFRIYDGEVPVNGVDVRLNDDIKTTNALGICIFSDLQTEDTYTYAINRDDYNNIEGEILLRTDTTVNLNYEDIKNDVIIQLTDSRMGFVLPASQVLLSNTFRQTDSEGKATYYLPSGAYELSASSDRYNDTTLLIRITRDTLIQLPLKLQFANIQFLVTYEQQITEGAMVSVDQKTETTNSLGVAVFSDLLVDTTYRYAVVKEGLGTYNGTFTVYHDTTLQIDLSETGIVNKSPVNTKIYPVPASRGFFIESEQEISKIILSDCTGRIVLIDSGLETKKHRVSAKGLKEGIYVLTVRFTNESPNGVYRVLIIHK